MILLFMTNYLMFVSETLAFNNATQEIRSTISMRNRNINSAFAFQSNATGFLRHINLAPLLEVQLNATASKSFTSERPKTLPIELKSSVFSDSFFSAKTQPTRFTSIITSESKTSTRPSSGYCNLLADGLYDDPDDCDNFIICYASRTFRTKCALGTKWNHLRKQCDYPDQVDCDRRPSTISTSTASTTKPKSTSKQLSKQTTSDWALLRKQNIPPLNGSTANTSSNASNYRSNVVLLSILLPLVFIAIVILVVSIYIWNRTYFDQTKRRFGINSEQTQSQVNLSSNLDDELKMHTPHQNPQWTCSWNPIYWSRRNHRSTQPQVVAHFCSKQGACMKSLKSLSQATSTSNRQNLHSTIDPTSLTNSHATLDTMTANQQNDVDDVCKIHDWDYNFATRGLYLSQPWVRGYYNRALASVEFASKRSATDFYGDSMVLTLEPCTEDDGKRSFHAGQTDTDGYYA